MLKYMATLIKENIRDVDFAARYGGEELSVILPYTGRTAASSIAEKWSGGNAGSTTSGWEPMSA